MKQSKKQTKDEQIAELTKEVIEQTNRADKQTTRANDLETKLKGRICQWNGLVSDLFRFPPFSLSEMIWYDI